MNHTRHHPRPGRPAPRPAPMHGSPLPFFHEPTSCAGHDFLVLNTRPDLARGEPGPAAAFLQRCFPREQT